MNLFRYTWRTFSRELVMLVAAALFCVPLYLVIVVSLKSLGEAYISPLALPADPQFANYGQAWNSESNGVDLAHGLLNTFVITAGSVICLIALGAPASYAIARRPSKLGTALYLLFVMGIVLPIQLSVIPLYIALRQLNLLGTYPGIIILWTGTLLPLAVFLFTGFIRALPRAYEEAAQVDGAGLVRTFVGVVFPLLRPITGTVAILAGLIVWNDFFVSVVFLSGSEKATFPVVMYSLVGEFVTQWNLIFATVAISVVPILAFYLLAQRHIRAGFASGIKG